MKLKRSSRIVKMTGILDRYYIPTRYPNGLPGGVPSTVYDEGEAKQALELAEKVVDLVVGKFPSESPGSP